MNLLHLCKVKKEAA